MDDFPPVPEGLADPELFNLRLGRPPIDYILDARGRVADYVGAVWVNQRVGRYGHILADISLASELCWPGVEVIVPDPGMSVECQAGDDRHEDCKVDTQARVLLQKSGRIFAAVPICEVCIEQWSRSVSEALRRPGWRSWVQQRFGIDLPRRS